MNYASLWGFMFKPLFVQIGHHFPTSVRLDDFDFLRKNNETSLNVAMTIFSTARYTYIETILRTTVSVKQKPFLATIKCPLFVFSSDIQWNESEFFSSMLICVTKFILLLRTDFCECTTQYKNIQTKACCSHNTN